MNDALVAGLTVFGLGIVAGLALSAALRPRLPVAKKPSGVSVALRLRAIRRSRASLLDERVAALERATAAFRPTGRVHRRPNPVVDLDALHALTALGYSKRDASARLVGLADGLSTPERVAAALREAGVQR